MAAWLHKTIVITDSMQYYRVAMQKVCRENHGAIVIASVYYIAAFDYTIMCIGVAIC